MNTLIDTFFNRAFDFSSRSNRKEFWISILAVNGTVILSGILVVFLKNLGFEEEAVLPIFSIFFLIFIPLTFIPLLAVSVRRLHDTNRSGFWLLLYLVPILGGLCLFIFFCLPGESKENKFGSALNCEPSDHSS